MQYVENIILAQKKKRKVICLSSLQGHPIIYFFIFLKSCDLYDIKHISAPFLCIPACLQNSAVL